jgi:hypothetical protein
LDEVDRSLAQVFDMKFFCGFALHLNRSIRESTPD